MDWKDILLQQAITTVIAIAADAKGKARFRKQLLKVFQKIAEAFPRDVEFQAVSGKGEK